MALENVVIYPALVLGIIIGLIELFFVHADENFRGSHWFAHGLHAIIFTILFVFINMNVDWVLNLINIQIPYAQVVVRGIIAIVAFIKIQGAAAGAGKAVREKLWHTLIIVALITASSYIWLILKPICSSIVDKAYC